MPQGKPETVTASGIPPDVNAFDRLQIVPAEVLVLWLKAQVMDGSRQDAQELGYSFCAGHLGQEVRLILTVLQGGLSPLRGPSASHEAEHRIDNIYAPRQQQLTDARRTRLLPSV
jgi:hypothetical protein